MKLTEPTINTLKNFSRINSNILFKPGNQLRTVNEHQTVFASATADDEFPIEFGIYDLSELLNISQLVGDLDAINFEFGEKNITITGGTANVKYWYAPKQVLTFPEKDINMPKPFKAFELSNSNFTRLKKAANTFGHPALSFYNQEDTILAKVHDPSNPTTNTFEIEIGEYESLSNEYGKFDYIFDIQNLKYLTEASVFDVEFAAKGGAKIAKFSSQDQPITYYVAVDVTSTLEYKTL